MEHLNIAIKALLPVPSFFQPPHEEGGSPVDHPGLELGSQMQFFSDLRFSPDRVQGVMPVKGLACPLTLPDTFIVKVEVVDGVSMVHLSYDLVDCLNSLPLVGKPWWWFPVRSRVWDI